MNNIVNKLLKYPEIASVLVFFFSFAMVIIMNKLFYYQHNSIESMLCIMSISVFAIYSYNLEEKVSKAYRIKYILYLSVMYIITSLSILYLFPGSSKLEEISGNIAIFMVLIVGILGFFFYFLSGYISNLVITHKKNKTPKNISPEKSRKALILLSLMLLSVFFLNILLKLKIVHINSNLGLIITLILPIGLLIFLKIMLNHLTK